MPYSRVFHRFAAVTARRSGSLGALAAATVLVLAPAAPALGQDSVFDCVVDPAQQVRVGSPVSGVVEEVVVRRGDFVERGEPLAYLESTIEQATVALDRVRAEATEELDASETRLALSRSRLERAEQLSRSGHAARERLDELEAEVKIAERAVANERLKRNIAGLELARAQAILERRTIRSPITGVVSERHLGPGEYTSQEAAIVTLVELDPLHVEAFVPVSYWTEIGAGVVGHVRMEQPIGGVHAARVIVLDRVFDAASSTFGVRLELGNPGGKLPAGQRCTVTFDLPGSGNVAATPAPSAQ